jgi:tetratricopeptide (TPR) repeat protein
MLVSPARSPARPFEPRPLRLAAVAILLTGAGLPSAARANQTPPAPAADAGERAPPGLDAGASFERARIYYESAGYERCARAFRALLDRPGHLASRDRSAARTYLAACLIAQGQVDEARQQFREGILENRQMEAPDPVVFPQSVVDVFFQVHSSLMDALRRQQDEELQRGQREAATRQREDALERERVRQLERLASQETLVHRNQRWMAWVPFGIGQFHNDNETLGWVFLTTEVALAVTFLTATSIELGLHSRANGGQEPLNDRELSSALDSARTVGTVAWVSLVGVAALGILEANLSFQPELKLGGRKRPLPESLRPKAATPATTLAPRVGSGWVGVGGTF